MKRALFIVILMILSSVSYQARSQDKPFRAEVGYIDSVLSKNPYKENFLGITYYYSLDITAEKEIIVKMDFNGPFLSTFKARLSDLITDFVVDTTEYTSSICWRCSNDESGKQKRCVDQENLYTSGDRDHIVAEDMCLMLPSQKDIRLKLINAIDELLKKARE
jgi:hypothetical protein